MNRSASYFDNDYAMADIARVGTPHLTISGAASHDLVAVPDTIAGIDVGENDVDGSGDPDNVRVLSASADAVFRYRGLEVMAETILRQERWGQILNHSTNQGLRAQIGTNDAGVRNYGVVTGQVGMFVLPSVLVGARASIGAVPLLSLGGRKLHDKIPGGDRRFDLDATVSFYGDGRGRNLGLSYRFTNFHGAIDMDGPNEHSVMLEGLFRL